MELAAQHVEGNRHAKDVDPGAEVHRARLFAWMFVTLVQARANAVLDSIGDETKADRDAEFRRIALAADTIALHVREDIADRLEAASKDLPLTETRPRVRAARLFCLEAKTAGGYRALYEQRQALAGGGAGLLDWAVRALRSAGAPEGSPNLRATLDRLLKDPPRTVSGTIRAPGLYRLESAWFAREDDTLADACVPSPWTTREPGVAFPARDYLGLALSGGGIRSATFNLGLLQALSEKGVLDHVDYLSTVSGGGYIGGFWSAWCARHPGESFPSWSTDESTEGREHPAVRHLREYSRFLIPRVGFGQVETWNAVVAFLGGILASVPVMTAAVALAYWLAMFVFCGLSGISYAPVGLAGTKVTLWGPLAFGWITFGVHVLAERWLWVSDRLGSDRNAGVSGAGLSIVNGLAAGGLWYLSLRICSRDEHWLTHYGWFDDCGAKACCVSPSLVWLVIAAGLLVVRAVSSRWTHDAAAFRAALDRAVARCIGGALIAGFLALVGWAAEWLPAHPERNYEGWAGALGGSATVVFIWLRDWLNKAPEKTRASAIVDRAVAALKPAMPKIAANVAVLVYLFAVGVLVRALSFEGAYFAPTTAGVSMAFAALVVLPALFWFDPARVGLHEFYRGRIARCFLGASRQTDEALDDGVSRRVAIGVPRGPAVTDEQPDDDLTFGELRTGSPENASATPRPGARRGPIHLVCCAANNLSGDVLGTLYRGARSAVISPFGITVGDYTAPQDDVSLSAALTASAAAFNSQMGALSMRLGPAVAFLMCVLNLRLGLWVSHPLNPWPKKDVLPGWYFFLEALARSRSDQVAMSRFQEPGTLAGFGRAQSKLHLSDGGHFENLGLYELVRRHCRYIIVSDATADPKESFESLGNAIRRVREDFGVEIDLDVTPLRAGASGRAIQHAVAGTIHYDGLDGIAKGQIIYIRPTFTGDEPPDLVEHHTRHPAFPNDSTGDQFYDEAQWESYRRLGQHCASAVLALRPGETENFIEELFYLAAERWQYVEPSTRDKLVALADRRASVETADVGRLDPFPEATLAVAPNTPADIDPLLAVVQLMEDVWRTAQLDTQWSLPENAPWMNYFERWANTPSFRRWWPLLRSLYDARFAAFIASRYDLEFGDGKTEKAHVDIEDVDHRHLLDTAPSALVRRIKAIPNVSEKCALRLTLHFEDNGIKTKPVVVAALLYEQNEARTVVTWRPEDYLIHAVVQRGHLSRHCIDIVTKHFGDKGVHELHVMLESRAARLSGKRVTGQHAVQRPMLRSPAERRALVEAIALYKSHGFDYCTSRTSDRAPRYLGVIAANWLVKRLPGTDQRVRPSEAAE